jgi:acyl dehydratase
MPIDVDRLLHEPPRVFRQSFTRRDTILYALGIGAGRDGDDLRYVYERALQAVPTLAIVLAAPAFWLDDPAYGIDWKKVVNAGQELELERRLPVEGDVTTTLAIDAVWDKGAAKGALMQSNRRLQDAAGRVLATIRQSHLLRGDGGFGGAPAPAEAEPALPERAPDAALDLATRPEQALLYRLSGDLNPLHVDPEVAHAAGFERPILHGSCTFGVVCRALLRLAGRDGASCLARFGARFSRPVLPGDTIRTEVWRAGNTWQFRARALERDVVVLDRGAARFADAPLPV